MVVIILIAMWLFDAVLGVNECGRGEERACDEWRDKKIMLHDVSVL